MATGKGDWQNIKRKAEPAAAAKGERAPKSARSSRTDASSAMDFGDVGSAEDLQDFLQLNPTKTKLYAKVIEITALNMIRVERIQRELIAMSGQHMWIVHADQPFLIPIKETYIGYLDTVKTLGKERNMGGPQGPLLKCLLDEMIKDPTPMTQEQVTKIAKVRDELCSFTDSVEVMEYVSLFKVQKAWSEKDSQKKIKLRIKCEGIDKMGKTAGALNSWLSHRSGQKKTGAPAAAKGERDLLALLRKLRER